MSEVSDLDLELSRKNLSAILQALASAGQAPVAKAVGVSESTISRLKSNDLEMFCKVLAALNLKCVNANHKVYDRAYIDSLKYLAGIGLDKGDVTIEGEKL